jgi:hypothetical protein
MDIRTAVSRLGGSVFGSGFTGWMGITLTCKGKGDIVPMERTLWLRPGSISSWNTLVSSSYIPGIISSLAGSGHSDLNPYMFADDMDVVFVERSPAWTHSFQDDDAEDFLTVSHIKNGVNPEYIGTYCYYLDEDMGYSVNNLGWTVGEAPDPVPLW